MDVGDAGSAGNDTGAVKESVEELQPEETELEEKKTKVNERDGGLEESSPGDEQVRNPLHFRANVSNLQIPTGNCQIRNTAPMRSLFIIFSVT